jgi:hypothetical protein
LKPESENDPDDGESAKDTNVEPEKIPGNLSADEGSRGNAASYEATTDGRFKFGTTSPELVHSRPK